jgi:cytochrome c6
MDMSIKTALGYCSLALLLAACGDGVANSEGSNDPGTAIFDSNCAMCHGRDGNLGMSGAKDLTKSTLSREEMIAVVTNGRGGMAPFGKMLSAQEIGEVVDHVRTLHTVE